ncbi:MAG TPA: riboflavin synthase [Balneolales bacterium]|nr:riboflavin synthase [Balneolales bacterium]
MFTGIIEDIGRVREIKSLEGGIEISISSTLSKELGIDDSISVNGVCQTVVAMDNETFTVQAVEETLRKTTFGSLKAKDLVNLERSMTLETRVDGHIVQGHVDTTGTITGIEYEGTNWLFTIRYPESFKDLIVGRGSISVDGISLTVAREYDMEFTLAIIPFTYDHTNLRDKKEGDPVNLEFDILGKYVQRYLNNRQDL